jgi:hypothetical protein
MVRIQEQEQEHEIRGRKIQGQSRSREENPQQEERLQIETVPNSDVQWDSPFKKILLDFE